MIIISISVREKNLDTKKTLNSMLGKHDDLDILRHLLCACGLKNCLFDV